MTTTRSVAPPGRYRDRAGDPTQQRHRHRHVSISVYAAEALHGFDDPGGRPSAPHVPVAPPLDVRFTCRVRLRRLSAALVVAKDRRSRGHSVSVSTVSVSSRPSRHLSDPNDYSLANLIVYARDLEFAYTLDGSGKITQTDVTNPRGFVRRVAFNAGGYPTSDTAALGESVEQTTTCTRCAAATWLGPSESRVLSSRREGTHRDPEEPSHDAGTGPRPEMGPPARSHL